MAPPPASATPSQAVMQPVLRQQPTTASQQQPMLNQQLPTITQQPRPPVMSPPQGQVQGIPPGQPAPPTAMHPERKAEIEADFHALLEETGVSTGCLYACLISHVHVGCPPSASHGGTLLSRCRLVGDGCFAVDVLLR